MTNYILLAWTPEGKSLGSVSSADPRLIKVFGDHLRTVGNHKLSVEVHYEYPGESRVFEWADFVTYYERQAPTEPK